MKVKVIFALTMSLVFLTIALHPVSAFVEREGQIRREIKLKKGQSAELFIGNGGVFIDEVVYNGTLVIISRPRVNRGWHVFTQRTLEIRVFDEEDQPVDRVVGLVRVFFNLDRTQRVRWNDETSNMSIWFRPQGSAWQKCVTHLVEESGYPHGRLYCLVKSYGLYGLAYTRPTLIMKLEKESP